MVGLGVAAALAPQTRLAEATASPPCAIGSSAASSPRSPAPTSTAPRDARVANTSNIGFEGIEAESLVIALRSRGHRGVDRIGVLVGHARAVARPEGDGPDPHDTQNAIRFSLGFSHHRRGCRTGRRARAGLVERLRAVTAGATSRGRDAALASREG